jgi:hypothetical protein
VAERNLAKKPGFRGWHNEEHQGSKTSFVPSKQSHKTFAIFSATAYARWGIREAFVLHNNGYIISISGGDLI